MKKRVLASICIGIMLIGSFTGCGKSDKGSPSTNTSQSKTASNETGKFSLFIRSQYHDWIKELKWYDVAEEKTGIKVEYVDGPEEIADTYTEVDQRIISGTLPDATMCKLSQAMVYGEQGAFADLAPYISKYAPNLQAYIDKNPEYKKLITNEKGAIYGLVKESPIFADLIGYRADQFKKAGINAENIKTVEDFTDAMRSLKKFYGKDNKNYYPLSGRESALRFAAWFKAASYVDENGSEGVYFGHEKDGSFNIKADGAYKWIETMKTWKDEGLINPSWIDGTNTEGDWESQTLSGNASIFYDYYNRSQWFMSNGGPESDSDYDMQILNFMQDENGKTVPVTCSLLYGSDCVTAVNVNAGEETIKSILKFVDFFFSEEGITLANWGVEGESYTVDNGSKKFIADYKTEESKPVGEKRWSFLSDRYTVCKPIDQTAFYSWNTELISEAANRCFVKDNLLNRPVIAYSTKQQEELANLVAAVYDSECAGLTAFINGSKELNEENWKNFIEEMDGLGLSKIEEIQASAYNN